MFDSLRKQLFPLSGVELPPSLEAIKINPSSSEFISSRIQAYLTGRVTGWTGLEAKVGICLYRGEGLVFVGSRHQASHRDLLEAAIDELKLPNPIRLDSLDSSKISLEQRALVQGGELSVSDFMSDHLLPRVRGESLTFGGFKGRLFGMPIEEAIARRVLREIVKVRSELSGGSGLDGANF
jgi:hypothetical protein